MKLNHTLVLLALALGLTLASCDKKKAPEISNENAKEVSPTVVLIEADITGKDISEYGVVFDLSSDPSLEKGQKTNGSLEGDHFQARIILLDSGCTYYFRVFATNDQGTTYSPAMSVTISYQNVGANDNAYPVVQ